MIRSLQPGSITTIASGLIENFLRQCADLGAGIMIGLYLRYINDNIHPVSGAVVGLIGVGFYFASLFFSPIMGALSDARGRKPFIILGALIGAVVVQVYPLTFSLWVFFVILMIEGMGNASEAPAMLGLLSDNTQTSAVLRGRVMAFYEIVGITSTAVGYMLGGFLWTYLGFNGFRVLSLIYLIGVGIVLWGVKEIKPAKVPTRRRKEDYLQVIKNPWVSQLLITGLFVNGILGIWFTQSAFQMSGELSSPNQMLMGGLTGAQIGIAFAIFATIFSTGAFFWGTISARVNRSTIMIIALFGMYLILLSLYIFNHFGGNLQTSHIFLFISLMSLLGGGIFAISGFTPVLLRYLADIVGEHIGLGGTVMGIYTVTQSLGRLGGGLFGGLFADMFGVDGMILLSVLLASIALAILLRIRKLDVTTR